MSEVTTESKEYVLDEATQQALAEKDFENRKEITATKMVKEEEVERDLTWEFEGKKYDLFLANGTGGIGMPIIHPTDKDKQLGTLSAQFSWDNPKDFIKHLTIETIDKASQHGDWTERENESMMLKNANLFKEIVVRGSAIDFDDLGEPKEAVEKDKSQMLAYRKPVQSDLIQFWLNECHIERYLPEGVTSIDAFLSNPTEIYFTIKIGDYNNPRHLLFVEFNAPSDEQIASYQQNSFSRGQNNEGDWKFWSDNNIRLSFAKKHLQNVQGAMLGKLSELDLPLSDLILMQKNNEAHLKQFKDGFNPIWMIRLGEELASAFSLGKK